MLTKNKTFAIPNFAEEAEMLEWAGISFGQENTIRLQKSIKVSNLPFLSLMFRIMIIEIGSYEWSRVPPFRWKDLRL